MSDESIAGRIERLVTEEHELRNREQVDAPDDNALEADRERLGAVEVELDAGADPDEAQVRDANTVEGYQQ
jgi:hypothetical protein